MEGLCSWGSKHFGIRPTLVLIAMADHAHNDGTGCYPSIATLARKTSLSIRGVQSTVRRLEQTGFLVAMGKSKGGRGLTTEYTLTLDKGVTCVPPFSSPQSNRRGPKNPERPAGLCRKKTPQALAGNPTAECSKTLQTTSQNPAPDAPESSGTNFLTKIGNRCHNARRRQDAESRGTNSTTSAAAFSTFGFEHQIGHRAFQSAIIRRSGEINNGNLPDIMELVIQDCEGRVPPRFYDAKHARERQMRDSTCRSETGAGANDDQTQWFSREEVRSYIVKNVVQVKQAAKALSGQQPELAAQLRETAKRLKSKTAALHASRVLDLEHLERELTAIEAQLYTTLVSSLGEELLRIQSQVAKDVALYRARTRPEQLAMIERDSVKRRLFEQFRLPRVSLFYAATRNPHTDEGPG